MGTRDLKFLLAYLTPLSCWISLTQDGWWSFTTVVFLFFVVPIMEQVIPQSISNYDTTEERKRSSTLFFDIVLYLNLPILYALLFIYLQSVSTGHISSLELIGNTSAIGIIIGVLGINVAHEIGHRLKWYHQITSQLLLLPGLYMHFNIEHNRGHHKWVATPHDPATSRKGESFFRFWPRTVAKSFLSAWKIENGDRRRAKKTVWTFSNKMVQFVLIEVLFIIGITLYFNLFTALMFIVSGIIGFTMLELVNYIEHYGLVRDKLPSGKYEPVESRHSWNSNHEIGRVLLYELTRHSDHHYKSTRKYQILRHFDESPQLPFGYPGSIIIALFPPLWFKMMNKQLALHKTSA